MIKISNTGVPSTLAEMVDCLKNPTSDKRSIAELDDVIDEIVQRNPDWVERIMKIVEDRRS